MTPRGSRVGKARRLARCTDPAGRAVMLAADQRGSLRRALDPADPGRVADSTLTEFKLELTRALGPWATAVLLDPEYGAPQAVDRGILPGSTGLVLALEATGHVGEPTDRRSRLLSGWSARRAVELGASAAKLLVHYHPDAAGAAEQERLVASTAEACAEQELPLIVEALSFQLDGRPPDAGERRRVVVASARRITAIDGVDVLKAEFPGTADAPRDWLAACESLNEASHVPWVLLSGGVDFESFARRAEVACISGASGLLAGRAVWNESVSMAAADRSRFYRTVGARRMARLREIVETSVTRPLPIEMGADPGSGPTFEGPIDR